MLLLPHVDPRHFVNGMIIGVSGGLDSVVLLHHLTQRANALPDAKLCVAHVNYRLRDTADADEVFVQQLAEQYGWPCETLRADSQPAGVNTQAWARTLRYDFFERIATLHACRTVAVAHHADDQAETLMWRLLRGTGLDGMAGMEAERALSAQVMLLRPFLATPRSALECYAQAHDLSYREDHTNQTDQYTRNRIRHELFPLCEAIQPGSTRHLAALTLRLQPDIAYLAQLTQEAWNGLTPQIEATRMIWNRRLFLTLAHPLQVRVLRHAYHLFVAGGSQLVEDHVQKMLQIAHGQGRESAFPGTCHFWCEGPYCVMSQQREHKGSA